MTNASDERLISFVRNFATSISPLFMTLCPFDDGEALQRRGTNSASFSRAECTENVINNMKNS